MELQKSAYPNFGQSLGIFGMTVLFTIVIGMPLGLLSFVLKASGLMTPTVESAISMCIYIGSFYLTYRWARKNATISNGEKGKVSLAGISAMVLAVGSLMVLALGFLIDPLTELIPRVSFFEELMLRAFRPDIFSFVTLAIAAPILEELIFRGIILDGFLKRYSPVKAILLSSLIFGLVHMNPSQVVSAFMGGLLLGWMYWKTGSLLPSIVLHFVNNCFAFIMVLSLSDPNASLYKMTGYSWAIYGAVVACAGGVLALGYLYFQRRYRVQQAAA